MSNVRPQKIKDFLGQKSVVQQTFIAMDSAKKENRPLGHMLMGGPPGLGKTTLAQIIANEMDAVLIYRIATAVTPEDLSHLFKSIKKLSTLEDIEQFNVIIFIDEIDRLDKDITNLLHTAMEDFTFSAKLKDGKNTNIKLPKFTLIGATNYLGELSTPFLNRFKIKVNFKPYSDEEIYTILVGAVKKLKINATVDGVREIASRSRGVPRIAIGYLEAARDVSIAYEDEFDRMLSSSCAIRSFEVSEIDHLGLNDLDRRILNYLESSEKPVGLKTLSQAVNEDSSTIELSESYLVRTRLIEKTARGRSITEEGKNHLERVEKC